MSLIIWVTIRVAALACTLVLLPLGIGYIFLHKADFDRGLVYLFGLCAFFAVFEVVYLPFFVIGRSFSMLTVVFFVLSMALALVGYLLRHNNPLSLIHI